jgi:hypothetical protein
VDTLKNREIIKILTKIRNISNHNSHWIYDLSNKLPTSAIMRLLLRPLRDVTSLTMFIPTRVIFCETTCDQMMKNDSSLCKFRLFETIYIRAKHCLNTTISHIRLCLI